MESEHGLKSKLELIFPHLNEKQRRILVAAEARQFGYGGISKVPYVCYIAVS